MDEAAIALELRWVRATRDRLTPAPPLPRGIAPQPCHWPAPCETCGSLEALPYCTDASRPFAAWTWRCLLDAGQPAGRPPGQRYTWSHRRNWGNVGALVRRTLSGDLTPPPGALEPDPAPRPWRM